MTSTRSVIHYLYMNTHIAIGPVLHRLMDKSCLHDLRLRIWIKLYSCRQVLNLSIQRSTPCRRTKTHRCMCANIQKHEEIRTMTHVLAHAHTHMHVRLTALASTRACMPSHVCTQTHIHTQPDIFAHVCLRANIPMCIGAWTWVTKHIMHVSKPSGKKRKSVCKHGCRQTWSLSPMFDFWFPYAMQTLIDIFVHSHCGHVGDAHCIWKFMLNGIVLDWCLSAAAICENDGLICQRACLVAYNQARNK